MLGVGGRWVYVQEYLRIIIWMFAQTNAILTTSSVNNFTYLNPLGCLNTLMKRMFWYGFFFHISDKVCELQKLSESYLHRDVDIERAFKTSLSSCESECLSDEKCQSMFYINGFCFIVYIDVPPEPYHYTALYYDKVCNHTYSKYSLKMWFVTTHVKKIHVLKMLTHSMNFELRWMVDIIISVFDLIEMQESVIIFLPKLAKKDGKKKSNPYKVNNMVTSK